MIVHLLESTLFLALAIVLAHLPRLAARTRYAIVFAALMKFAIPSAIVPRILALCGINLAGMAKGTIVIEALGPLASNDVAASGASPWPLAALTIWVAVAMALFGRALVRGRRAVRGALSDVRDAGTADLVALERARVRAGVTRHVRLVRSSAVTPSTVGIFRPMIVIPFARDLADAELETILAHECAHIARRDNLLNIIESIAGCALWFHPLVWIARRVLDAAREEACDAIVVASGNATIYITALGKVCGAIAPRTAGVSCIVSNTIRERIEAIMSFGTRRLLPHRAVTAMVITFLALATIGSGVARALPAQNDDASSPYKVEVKALRLGPHFDFLISIRSRTDAQVIYSTRLRSAVEEWATAQSVSTDTGGEHHASVRAKGHADGTATVEITTDGGAPVVTTIVAKTTRAVRKEAAKGPDTISIELKDADIRDVMRTFTQLTNITIIVDDDVTGRVTEVLHDVPWTEAFDHVLLQNNLRSERTGNTIYVHRR